MTDAIPFFTEDSEFLKHDTRKTRWAIPYHPECLNARVEILLAQQQDAVAKQRILDLGSHIGTWAWAALKLGADYVKAVDADPGAIATSSQLFDYYRVTGSKCETESLDVLPFLENLEAAVFDTVLCFGLLYYVAEPFRLLKLMARAARKTVLLDTFTAKYAAVTGKDAAGILPNVTDATWDLPMLLTTLTQAKKKDYTLPGGFDFKDRPVSLTSFPTEPLLETWFHALGLSFQKLDWSRYKTRDCTWRDFLTPEQKKNSHWADVYTAGLRVAYRLEVKR